MSEEKGEFSAACEIEKIAREENGLEKNESENEDGLVEHCKEQELEKYYPVESVIRYYPNLVKFDIRPGKKSVSATPLEQAGL